MAAECSEGIGSETFMPYFEAGSSEKIAAELIKDYKINGHTALALKTKAEKAKILLFSSLPDKIVEKCGLIPVHSRQEAVEVAQSFCPRGSMGAILPKAYAQVPVIKKDLG